MIITDVCVGTCIFCVSHEGGVPILNAQIFPTERRFSTARPQKIIFPCGISDLLSLALEIDGTTAKKRNSFVTKISVAVSQFGAVLLFSNTTDKVCAIG